MTYKLAVQLACVCVTASQYQLSLFPSQCAIRVCLVCTTDTIAVFVAAAYVVAVVCVAQVPASCSAWGGGACLHKRARAMGLFVDSILIIYSLSSPAISLQLSRAAVLRLCVCVWREGRGGVWRGGRGGVDDNQGVS